MEYTKETFDRSTGDAVVVSIGDWITITELGERHGVGSRRVRSVLRKMEFLQVEGAGPNQRHRLCRWVAEKGWGKRIEHKNTVPFDVVSPEGQAWVAERWEKAVHEIEAAKDGPTLEAATALTAFKKTRRRKMEVQMMVSWLVDHFPRLGQAEIGLILDVSQPLVSRLLNIRKVQIKKARARKIAPLPEVERRRYGPDESDWRLSPSDWAPAL